MSESTRPSRDQAVRQVKQHLRSLGQAGVKWLPVAPPPGESPPAAPQESAAPAASAASPRFEESPASGANTGLSPEQRRQELKVLAEKITTCMRCAELASSRTQTVFGVGQIDIELCFIGEAPGR